MASRWPFFHAATKPLVLPVSFFGALGLCVLHKNCKKLRTCLGRHFRGLPRATSWTIGIGVEFFLAARRYVVPAQIIGHMRRRMRLLQSELEQGPRVWGMYIRLGCPE